MEVETVREELQGQFLSVSEDGTPRQGKCSLWSPALPFRLPPAIKIDAVITFHGTLHENALM